MNSAIANSFSKKTSMIKKKKTKMWTFQDSQLCTMQWFSMTKTSSKYCWRMVRIKINPSVATHTAHHYTLHMCSDFPDPLWYCNKLYRYCYPLYQLGTGGHIQYVQNSLVCNMKGATQYVSAETKCHCDWDTLIEQSVVLVEVTEVLFL